MTTAPETEKPSLKREIEERVLQEWAELATAWGVSPVLGRIHGLLILNGQPMTAEEICERLQISRASASVQLNAILDWGLARRLFVPGDRRQYYQGDQDHWNWFRRAAIGRKRREFDPVVDRIGEALVASRSAADNDPELIGLSDRLASLHQFVSELFRGVGLVLEEEEALLHYLLSLSQQDLEELREILRLALGRADDQELPNEGQHGAK